MDGGQDGVALDIPAVPVDFATVGETMVVLAPPPAVRLEEAAQLGMHIGGAESNVAVYLAELGFRSVWCSRLGADPFGRVILRELSAAGVDVSTVETVTDGKTAVYFKDPGPQGTTVYYYRAYAAARGLTPAALDLPALAGARVLHLSGITAALSASARALVERAVAERRDGQLVTFDVNYRPGLWEVAEAGPVLRSLAARADVCFVGLDEARVLWGCETAEEVRELLPAPTLVVKDSDVGAHSFSESGYLFVPSRRVEVVEAVGAGDAFAAGWIAGFLGDGDERYRLRLGHLLAAAALGVTSDHAALPLWAELDRLCRATDADWAAVEDRAAAVEDGTADDEDRAVIERPLTSDEKEHSDA